MSTKLERRIKLTAQKKGWAGGEVRLLDIRAGDTVEVLAGRDRGKRGVVERTLPSEQRLVVRGVNIHVRHTRAGMKQNQAQGGKVDFFAPMAYSNVMLVCSRCDKRTRIHRERDDKGVSHIVCGHCGERHERTAV